jgi:hypothetical protein
MRWQHILIPVLSQSKNNNIYMLNLDQAFTVQEFVRKNRTKRIWEIQDELYSLICNLTKTEEKKNETETAAA